MTIGFFFDFWSVHTPFWLPESPQRPEEYLLRGKGLSFHPKLLSDSIQYLRGDASWPTKVHNTLARKTTPIYAFSWNTHAHECAYTYKTRSRVKVLGHIYPGALSYQSSTDNTYLYKAVFLLVSRGVVIPRTVSIDKNTFDFAAFMTPWIKEKMQVGKACLYHKSILSIKKIYLFKNGVI